MRKKRNLFIILAIAVSILSGCGAKKDNMTNVFTLDNPTGQAIEVTINENDFSLDAGSTKTLTLKPGLHEMIYDGETSNFRVTIHNRGGIINPTRSLHAIYGVTYFLEDSDGHGYQSSKSALIDGVEYTGEIYTTDSLLIDNSHFLATYTVGEPFPDVITTTDSEAKDTSVRKFFTKQEFIDFYDVETQMPDYYEDNKIENGETTITNPEQPRFPEYDFTDEGLIDLQSRAQTVIESYQDAESVNAQKPFLDEYYALLLELNDIRPEDPLEREKRDNLQETLASSLLAGIFIVD